MASYTSAYNAPNIARPASSGTTLMFAYLGRRNIISMLVGTTIALVVGISLVLILAMRSLRKDWKRILNR